jgi:2-polyprenyl-3-methyl-5-hydroxy-6-metoxy-1,4-benzoquinol methylase
VNYSENKLYEYRSKELSIRINEARISDAIKYYEKYKDKLISRSCPVCNYEKFDDYLKYSGVFPVVRCRKCTMIYSHFTLGAAGLVDYYENSENSKLLNDFYRKRSQSGRNVSASRIKDVCDYIANYLGHCKALKVLEIGCGNGSFLKSLSIELSERGIGSELYGAESSSCEAGIAVTNGIKIINQYIELPHVAYIGQEFDLVLMYEVIEHLPDPRRFMFSLYNIMNEGAAVILTTPNVGGLENLLSPPDQYRLLAHAVCPPAHINGFDRGTINFLLMNCKFNIIKNQAKGYFDAYAAQDYFLENRVPLNWLFVRDVIDNIRPDIVQEFINGLDASSTMTIIAERSK